MSLVKYRIREVAADFGIAAKDVSAIVEQYFEKPKSTAQPLDEQQLNLVFDVLTQRNQIESVEAVFAAAFAAKQAEEKRAEEKRAEEKHADRAPAVGGAEETPAGGQSRAESPKPVAPSKAEEKKPAQSKQQPQKQPAEQRKRERRVVDTSAVQVNADRFDDRVDTLISERDQNRSGGKQKITNKKQKQQQVSKGAKSKEDERKRMNRLRLEVIKKTPLTVKIPDEITVGELAMRMKKTAGELIKCLIKNGVMATVNQTIDFDTAEFVATELGCKVEREIIMTIEDKLFNDHEDTEEELVTRPPVVVVMGHVDHGKTSLLDAVRKTNVVAGEAGGITQHIGAYTVKINDKLITFLDTPGHAAFTSMRARGAMCTDVAILVVAADDGIMPQTIEAINHAKAANIPIIVAVNKMDKPGANPDRVLTQLTEHELVPAEWGGDTEVCRISAKQGTGIDELLETVILTAELQDLKANPNRAAKGTIIEARLDKTRGPIATLLVQNGTLHQGDLIIAGTAVGHVRVMTDDKGKSIQHAGPSIPVEITGLAETPGPGDSFEAVSDERMARQLVEQRKQRAKDELAKLQSKVTLENLFDQMKKGEMKELNILVKADVQGSAEAVKANLMKLNNEEVVVKVIHSGVGAISESDILLASTANAIIVGFNVRPDAAAAVSAQRSNVDIRLYSVIYECLEEIESAMKGMLAPKYREAVIGHAEVRVLYKVSAIGTVAGCYVKDGKITRDCKVRVLRDNVVIYTGELGSLQRFKDSVKEVQANFECGMSVAKYNDLKEGDIFECFIMEQYRD
ncbi:MAG: translation initiation factor IF-2 [Oscillospiraceae bacterium]|nr:translation initiation factor IF-2 [Oscillospiraceae bacterium]